MAVDPIDYQRLKRLAVPYGAYFGFLQLPVAWIFGRWLSMPLAYAASLTILTLLAYSLFKINGLPIYFFKWRTGNYWTFSKWLVWTAVMGGMGFLIGQVFRLRQ